MNFITYYLFPHIYAAKHVTPYTMVLKVYSFGDIAIYQPFGSTVILDSRYYKYITKLEIKTRILGKMDLKEFSNLEELENNYENNYITGFKNYPAKLSILRCRDCKIETLDDLPDTLTQLYCCNNQIKKLDNLPPNLILLNCARNLLTSLDKLPRNIVDLHCRFNNGIAHLDNLPEKLQPYRDFLLEDAKLKL